MLLVEICFLNFAALDELDDPAGIEIDTEGDAAAVLGEVLDGQAQAARAAWAEHEPITSWGKCLILQGLGKVFVVDAEVFDLQAALGDAGGAAGFEDVHGAAS